MKLIKKKTSLKRFFITPVVNVYVEYFVIYFTRKIFIINLLCNLLNRKKNR